MVTPEEIVSCLSSIVCARCSMSGPPLRGMCEKCYELYHREAEAILKLMKESAARAHT